MTVTFPHGGRMSPEQLAAHTQRPTETLARLNAFFQPRINEGQVLRGRVGEVESKIAGYQREIRTHEETLTRWQGRTTSEARTAVREARAGIASLRGKIAEEQRDLPGLREAYNRHMSALARDMQARLDSDLPGARELIDGVRTEALADQAAARDSYHADVNREYGAPGTWRRFFNDWNPLDMSGALDLENDRRMIRQNEADRSITIYQRLRQSYESLRPTATDRLPYDPSPDDAE